MATPLSPVSAAFANLRPKNQSGQPSWTCITAEVIAKAAAGTAATIERMGVQAWSIVGISIGSAPTASQFAAAMVSNKQASKVYYIEAWAQDGRVLGTGWVTWWYIAGYTV